LKRIETSNSWREFLTELEAKCQEQEISLSELAEWIRNNLEEIEKKEFDYYITSGATPHYSDLKLDVTILTGNYIHGFSIFRAKKEFSLYPVNRFFHYREEIIGDNITAYFSYGEMLRSFTIEDKVGNYDRLRRFVRKILDTAWKTQ
jgi:hypothetical protein